MQRLVLYILCFSLLGCGAILFLHNTPAYLTSIDQDGANDEAVQHRKLEKQMLADPNTGEIPEGMTIKNLNFLKALQNENSTFTKKTRGAEWRSRGPWNVGGRTRAMAIDVMDENHLIAGGVSGGIWQSLDAGTTWTRVSPVNGHPSVVSISQDARPGKTNLWYAFSGEATGTSASGTGQGSFYLGDGAFKSTDNGTTWTPIASTAIGSPNSFSTDFQVGWRITTSPVDSVDACLYLATIFGTIYRSRDTGNSWTPVLGNGNSSYYTDVKVSSTGKVYAALDSRGTTNGFFRSGNGISFTNITPPFLKSHERTAIEINPNNENEVFFLSVLPDSNSGGVETSNFHGDKEYVSLVKYTYLSGDGSGIGGIWENLSGNLPVNSVMPFDKFNCQGGYDLAIKMQPGSNTLIIGGTNLYRSTDAFSTPYNITQMGGYGISTTLPYFTVYPNHHPDQHDIFFLKSDPKKMYSISDGGVKFTEDVNASTVVWKEKSLGYVTSQVYTLAIDEEHAYDPTILAGFQDNGNYITSTNVTTSPWAMPFNGDGAYNYISPDKSFHVMSKQLGHMVKLKLDKQGNLIARRRIDPTGFKESNYAFINPFIVDPNNQNILYTPIGKRIARQNNLTGIAINNQYTQINEGWTILSDTITTPRLISGGDTTLAEISRIAVSKSEPNILYVGTNLKEMFRVENANTGDPKFIKLDAISKRLPPNGYVSGIAVDPDSASNVLICYSNYNMASLYFSRDYGETWFFVGGNLERGSANPTGGDPSIRCVNILVAANGKRTYFAGTSIGLFSTDTLILGTSNNASTNKTVWKQEGADIIGAAIVTDIKVRRSDGYIAVGTHGNGVFESYYLGGGAPIIASHPEVSMHPNPANSVIYFSFEASTLNSDQKVVFDISGRRVGTLQNGIENNGIRAYRLDVSRYANGHYFLSYGTIDNHKQVKHFIVQH